MNAKFTKLGTLTTWVRGGGVVNRTPEKEEYLPGEVVKISAQAGGWL